MYKMQSLQPPLQWHDCPRGLTERANSQRKLKEAAMWQQTAHNDLMRKRGVQAQLVSAQFAELRRNSFEEPSIGSSGPLVDWEPSTDTACVESAWDKDYDDERAKKRFRVDDRVRASSRDAD
jgi:hypothetical protein